MNLETYLRTTTGAGYDPYGLRQFASQLVEIRRTANELVDVLDNLDKAERSTVHVDNLRCARDLACEVSAFFPGEFYIGRRVRELAADLRYAVIQAGAYPDSFDMTITVPLAVTRARRLERYLGRYGASEIACSIGRARTLYDSAPFIILFIGAISGVGTYISLLTMLPTVWWLLNAGLSLVIGSAAAATVDSSIRQVLEGERVVLPWPLIAFTLRVIPHCHRARYTEEFRAELHALSPWKQLVYSINQASRAAALRSSLADERTIDADSATELP